QTFVLPRVTFASTKVTKNSCAASATRLSSRDLSGDKTTPCGRPRSFIWEGARQSFVLIPEKSLPANRAPADAQGCKQNSSGKCRNCIYLDRVLVGVGHALGVACGAV